MSVWGTVLSLYVIFRSCWPQHGTMQAAEHNQVVQACCLVIMSSCCHLNEVARRSAPAVATGVCINSQTGVLCKACCVRVLKDVRVHECRKDGDVYRSLLEVAQRSPFNDTEEGPAWKPVLEARLNPNARANAKL